MYETMFCHADAGFGDKPALFVSPTCFHVENAMHQAGVRVSDSNKQPSDYLPTELQFLSFLCNAAAHELIENGRRGEGLERLLSFKDKHVDRWIPDFMESVSSKTKLEEYRLLTKLAFAGLQKIDAVLETLKSDSV